MMRTMARRCGRTVALAAGICLLPGVARAQQGVIAPGWARLSIFGQAASTTPLGGGATTFGEIATTMAVRSPTHEGAGTEYDVDLRLAGYPTVDERATRVSIYEASVTQRFRSGTMAVRAGQMWLTEVGALGSIGGALLEYRQPKPAPGRLRLRAALFAGLEPRILEAGYVSGVRKAGGFLSLEGSGARRHVLGYVTVRDTGMTERSVLATSNYLPVGRRFFAYQAAEIDLTRPGGAGSGLAYFFANARFSPNDVVDLQGSVHRGRSIDTRTITQELLQGRPVDARMLEGLRYESVGGRVTVRIVPGVRIFGGLASDRNNREDARTTRVNAGLFASNLAKTGLDVQVSDNRVQAPTSSYDSWYASVGRQIGSRVYLTGEFGSSLSLLRPSTADLFAIESRPRTERFGASAVVNATRHLSLLLTGDIVRDPAFQERRMLAGITYRF